MNFLQPTLLWALPLIALPIIIHLINQRRYQTIRWAAMMFLLAANRMSRGYARIRQWLIMAARMLAIAGLVFAISRPLASGWLGLAAGGRADTTIILLDRSPSMQQNRAGAGASKLETGRRQLVQALATLGSNRWVLIDSASAAAHEIDSPDSLLNTPYAEAASASADLPAMLQAAHDYIRNNNAGRTEVWICSDLRVNDWDAESSRWQSLREAFLEFPQGVRFHLLAYPQVGAGNIAIRVTEVEREETSNGPELVLSMKLSREGGEETRESIPLSIEIEGARSEFSIEMNGPQYELKEHRIPLEKSHVRGWGRVSIPADANPGDNDYCFVFDQPAPRRTLVVSDDPLAARPLLLSAAIAPDPSVKCTAEVISPTQLATVEWDPIGLVLWHGALSEGADAQSLVDFVDRGGQVMFLPPSAPSGQEAFGVRWQSWTDEPDGVPIETWRGDQDLLANTQSGRSLPVGTLEIRRYCGMAGEFTQLATLRGGAPVLARVATNRGGVYFCATTPATGDSSLANNGVVLYVMIQRALMAGAAVLGNTRELIAGNPQDEQPGRWQPVGAVDDALSAEYAFQRGVYASGERLVAVNRAPAEDQAAILDDARVAGLFRGLDFSRVDDQAGNLSALIQEIWRIFLVTMIIALIVEAALCMPRVVRPAGGAA